MLRSAMIGIVVLAATAQVLEAQRRAAGAGADRHETAEVGILAGVGGRNYTSRVPGTCRHEPSAAIFGVPAALWMVEARGVADSEVRGLSVTLWQPKDGSADQLSLTLDVGREPISLEVNPRERAKGTASIQVRRSGAGGTFEVRGQDAAGSKVSLTITCPVFGAVVAEGG